MRPSQRQGDHLRLKPSWCKGGRTREIPILTIEQRKLLRECHVLVVTGSLIPPERTYIEQRRIYERHAARAGLSKLHGLRHAYAQTRYQELTGSAHRRPAGRKLATSPPNSARTIAELGFRSAANWAMSANRSPPST